MSTSCANRVAQSLAVLAALLLVVVEPSAQAATVPPIPRPATVMSVSPTRTDLHVLVQGQVCGDNGNTCNRILYRPMNDPSGVAALEKALTTTTADKVIVFGYSEGATVVAKWLAEHQNDPDAPSTSVMSIVVIGNPTRTGNGITVPNGVTWPESPYQVIDVARQYDGVADYPNNADSPYYWLAAVNATRGTLFGGLHNYSGVDIYDEANAVWTSADGNITYVLVPTQNLPILGGLAKLFPKWNVRMKAQIETAYIRPVPFPTPAPATPAVAALRTISDFTVAPEHSSVPDSVAPPATAPSADTIPANTQPDQNDIPGTHVSDGISPAPSLPDAEAGAAVEPVTAPPAEEPQSDTVDLDLDTTPADDITASPIVSNQRDRAHSEPAATPSTKTARHPSLLRRLRTAITARPNDSTTPVRRRPVKGR